MHDKKVNSYLFSQNIFYIFFKMAVMVQKKKCTMRKHNLDHVTIAGEGLQNFGLCSVLRALEQGGIFIVPHLM
jgi:hypothetical protein